jgi:flagellar hook-associated protein FlgK
MNTLASISLSGMNAAQVQLQSSAHNIANNATEGFKRQEVDLQAQAGGGVTASVSKRADAGSALEQDVVDQLSAKNSFLANLAVFKRTNEMAGALLDTKA